MLLLNFWTKKWVPNGHECSCCRSCCYQIFNPLKLLFSRPIAVILFTHINDSILHEATVADS